jgi:hypothetical protein
LSTAPTATQMADVVAETARLEQLDFAPTCDFHRIYFARVIPASHSFNCRSCKAVEHRCIECVEYFAPIPHTETSCQHCHLVGCFHAVVHVLPIGAR